MLPYPTDGRRLLMMVRSFVSQFEDYLHTRWHGSPYPSHTDDPEVVQLEEFLEQLALQADEDDESVVEYCEATETVDEVMDSLQHELQELLRQASWNDERKLSPN